MENQNSESQSGRIIGYCFIAIIAVLLCIVITLKLEAARRVRRQSSGSNSNNRNSSTPDSYRRSRRKTLSRTALDQIPIYRTRDFPSSGTRSGTPDMERGIAYQQTSSNHSSRTFSPELTNQNLALLRLDSSLALCGSTSSTCAVCSEEFTGDQLLRYLPCHHHYHAECVDSWLVNVSGSCPLCRMDLCATLSHEETNAQQNLLVQPPQAVIAQHRYP